MNLLSKTILLFTSLGCLFTILTSIRFRRTFLKKGHYIVTGKLFSTIAIIEPLMTGCLTMVLFNNDNSLVLVACTIVCIINALFIYSIYDKYAKLILKAIQKDKMDMGE